MPGSCSYFTYKVWFENSIFRLRVISMEMFWYIGNALDFRPRGPWFESGRLQQFVFFTFLSFWPFTVPSPLLIKTRRIANNVINNYMYIYFIITLLSLDPIFFACNPLGDDFFSNLDSTFLSFASNIAVISAWFLLIFEYVVAETIYYLKCSLIFFSLMSSWSVDDNHQHHHHHHHHRHHHYCQDHHHDHHCLHVCITSPFLNIVNIIIYHKTWRQTTLFVLVTN